MKEQVRAWATEVWQTSHWTNEQIKRLERFAILVRNKALEEAAQKCRTPHGYFKDGRTNIECALAIESLKEPTP